MTRISFQLYSVRDFDLPAILPQLVKIGLQEVEGYGRLYADADNFQQQLAESGLRMSTGHFDLAMLRDDPGEVIRIASLMNMESVIIPFLTPEDRPTDFTGWQAFAATLAEAGKPVIDAGLSFGWHNHAFEFTACENGRYPIEAIMEASDHIGLEIDLAWVHVAGEDPVTWLETYAGRLLAAHVKDCAPDGECADEDGWADVGHGVMNWDKIVPAMRSAGAELMVLEHDNPSDAMRFATRSFTTASAF